MVGVNNETKPMECSGSWEKVECNCNEKILDYLNFASFYIFMKFSTLCFAQVQEDMKMKLGDEFEAVKVTFLPF